MVGSFGRGSQEAQTTGRKEGRKARKECVHGRSSQGASGMQSCSGPSAEFGALNSSKPVRERVQQNTEACIWETGRTGIRVKGLSSDVIGGGVSHCPPA